MFLELGQGTLSFLLLWPEAKNAVSYAYTAKASVITHFRACCSVHDLYNTVKGWNIELLGEVEDCLHDGQVLLVWFEVDAGDLSERRRW